MSKFIVKRNNGDDHQDSQLIDMLKSAQFTDCELSSSGETIKAHKVVLASASPFFKEYFLSSSYDGKIELDHINIGDLRQVVSFIYTGSMEIEFMKLNAFLLTAQTLKVTTIRMFKIEIADTPIETKLSPPPGPQQSTSGIKKPSQTIKKRRTTYKCEDKCKFCPYQNRNTRTMYNHQRHCQSNPNKFISRCPICKVEVKSGSMTFHKKRYHNYVPRRSGQNIKSEA